MPIVDTITDKIKDIIGRDKVYSYDYDVYPSNLVNDPQLGHMMKLTAYTNGTTGTGWLTNTENWTSAPASAAYSAYLYIPGGAGTGASSMAYEDIHDYMDVKLTAPIVNSMLGVSAAAGVFRRAINPAIQVIYRSTQLRRFVYSFLFTPTNEQESRSMYSIVHNIRRFSAPDLVNHGWLFVSPAEWEISFYFNGQENMSVPRIKRCALVKCQADFASQGEWSTFNTGHPVSCLFTMEFEEMEIIHRQYIEDGF